MAVVYGVVCQASLGTAAGLCSHSDACLGKGRVQAVSGRCPKSVLGPSTRVFSLEAAGPPQQAEATPTSCQAGVPCMAPRFIQTDSSKEGAAVPHGTQPRDHVRPTPTRFCWLGPVAGRCHRAQGRARHRAAGSEGPPHRPSATATVSTLLNPKRVRGYFAPCAVKGGGSGSRTGNGGRGPVSAWGCLGGLAFIQNLLVRRLGVSPGPPYAADTSKL